MRKIGKLHVKMHKFPIICIVKLHVHFFIIFNFFFVILQFFFLIVESGLKYLNVNQKQSLIKAALTQKIKNHRKKKNIKIK